MAGTDTNSLDDIKPKWNLIQFGFACVMVIDFRMFWRFVPYLNKYGTYALIPFYIFLILVIIPVVFVQLKTGAMMQKGIVGICSKYVPILKGAAIAVLLHNIIESFYYAVFTCWCLYYMFASVVPNSWGLTYSGRYPWFDCSNNWKRSGCDADRLYWDKLNNPSEQFFKNQFLALSSGIDNPDGVDWPLPICLLVVWILICVMTLFGARVYGKILYAISPLSVVCMIIILIYGNSTLGQTGQSAVTAESYLSFYTANNDSSSLSDMWMWVLGFYQHYIFLKLWLGFLPAMGKYAGDGKRRKNFTWLILMCVYVILPHVTILTLSPYFANMANALNAGKPDEFVSQLEDPRLMFISPKLLFVSFTEVFGIMQDFNAAILFLFFFMFLLYGLQNMALRVLLIIDGMEELFPKLTKRRLYRIIATAVFCTAAFLLGLPLVSKGGYYLILLIDSYLYAGLFFTVLFSGVGFLIAYGKQYLHVAEKLLITIWFGIATLICVAFGLLPLVLQFEDWYPFTIPTYAYVYPWSYVTMGWLLFMAPIVFGLVLGTVHACIPTSGDTENRVRGVFCGEEEDFEEKEEYSMDAIENRGFHDGSNRGRIHDGSSYGRSSSFEQMNRF